MGVPGEFEKYVILTDEATREQFLDAARYYRWVHVATHEPRQPVEAYEQIWSTPDRRTAIHYIEDPVSNQRFLWVRGAEVERCVHELRTMLMTFRAGELIELAGDAREHNERVDAVLRLGVVFTRFDAPVMQVYCDYLEDPDPLLRRATLLAMSYRSWPEILPLVEKVATEDPDEEVRNMAKQIAASLNRPSP